MVSNRSPEPGAKRSNSRAKSKPSPWPRLAIAVLPGYLVAIIAATALTIILPLPRGEATLFSLILAGLFYAGAFVLAFAAKSWGAALKIYAMIALPGAAIVAINLLVAD